jgi:hypothetical protein
MHLGQEGRIALKPVSVTSSGRERIVPEVVTRKLRRCVGALTLLLLSVMAVLLMKCGQRAGWLAGWLAVARSNVAFWYVPSVCSHVVLFQWFRRVQKIVKMTISFVMSVRLYGTPQLPLCGFS